MKGVSTTLENPWRSFICQFALYMFVHAWFAFSATVLEFVTPNVCVL
jgi:hypothetical protein